MMCYFYLILSALCFSVANLKLKPSRRCGMERTPIESVYPGSASVETYPWLGRLFYPFDVLKLSTTVVLITKEMVIASAFDIDKYPKTDFRLKARVVLGSSCNGTQLGVRDYAYHPEYKENTSSTLALIQLDVQSINSAELQPICPPVTDVGTADFYAFTLTKKCDQNTVGVFRMEFVNKSQCKAFYRKSGLDLQDLWPTHTACARATAGRPCVWRNGAVLALREHGRWRLAGLGVYGPGCRAPSRFLDFGMYHPWVRQNILRVGRPAVTMIAPNHLILRRTTSRLQRFGPCDPEERVWELYSDSTTIQPSFTSSQHKASYSLTLFTNMDYNCIILRVHNMGHPYDPLDFESNPRIRLQRFCTTNNPACFSLQMIRMEFSVEITFFWMVNYTVRAYGREARIIDRKQYLHYMNQMKRHPVFTAGDRQEG